MLPKMWRMKEWNLHTLLVEYKIVQLLGKENGLVFSQNGELPLDPAILLLCVYPRAMTSHSHKNLYTNVLSSIIPRSGNNPNAHQDKQNVV